MQNKFIFKITGPDFSQEFPIPLGVTLVGREATGGLTLAHPLVSRRHAEIITTGTDCQITDLGSANGTYLNGTKLDPQAPVTLNPGDMLRIGPFELIFQLAAPEAAAQTIGGGASQPETPTIGPKPIPETGPVVAPDVLFEEPAAEEEAGSQPEAAQPKAAPAAPEIQPVEPPGPEIILPAGPILVSTEPLPQFEEPEPLDSDPIFPPGLTAQSLRLINYLPPIYHTDFMQRFLALFESILLPVEWTIDNFDLYLDPGTSPAAFLPWLANWYQISFDDSWSEDKRRLLIKSASEIYARRGTRRALSRALEIYTGSMPQIIEFANPKDPFTFTVILPAGMKPKRELIERLIDASKPAHTSYQLEFKA